MLPRGGNRGFRYTPNARNTPDAAVPPQGVMGGMLHVPSMELNAVPSGADTGVPQPVPISALASALASAPPEQQRAVRLAVFCLILSLGFFQVLMDLTSESRARKQRALIFHLDLFGLLGLYSWMDGFFEFCYDFVLLGLIMLMGVMCTDARRTAVPVGGQAGARPRGESYWYAP